MSHKAAIKVSSGDELGYMVLVELISLHCAIHGNMLLKGQQESEASSAWHVDFISSYIFIDI